MATGVGWGKCDWQHSMAHPRNPPPLWTQKFRRYLLHKPSYSQFCPKFRCHGNRGRSGGMRLAAFNDPSPKNPYRRKNLADVSYTRRVIASFVLNSVAMATGVGRGKCDWQYSMVHPRKPPYRCKKSRRYLLHKPSCSQFCPKFWCHGNGGRSGEMLLAAFDGPSPKTPL